MNPCHWGMVGPRRDDDDELFCYCGTSRGKAQGFRLIKYQLMSLSWYLKGGERYRILSARFQVALDKVALCKSPLSTDKKRKTSSLDSTPILDWKTSLFVRIHIPVSDFVLGSIQHGWENGNCSSTSYLPGNR